MKRYKVLLMPSAVRDLDLLSGSILARLEEMILSLAENPRPMKVKKLVGSKSQWRIPVGNYRVLYEIDDKSTTVRVFRVRHRRGVYR
ncbi:MAG: type II toxin-antitoxin system RelE/ParE family toxin [bacterium]